MSGTLYICGTPIGNLDDITLRALETLKKVDVIACEDTRRTIKLLNHYNIKKRLTSYHEHNKKSKGQALVDMLTEGKDVAFVSDAGMPAISDPGLDLIRLCYENKIPVTCCPGPTAAVCALVLSGMDTRRYVFEGFLPYKKKEREKVIDSFKCERRTIALYESPHRLAATLSELGGALGKRRAAVVREITKIHEQVITGDLNCLADVMQNNARGEFVIIIEGAPDMHGEEWNTGLTVDEHMALYMKKGFDKKESMKMVARDRGVSKSEIYARIIKGEQ